MDIIKHNVSGVKICEITGEDIIISTADDILDVIGNLYYITESDKIIIHEKNIVPDFFDLKNRIAGEVLQKISNYRLRLAIVGDFSKYTKKSIKDFIFESNKTGRIHFVGSISEAIKKLS
jgi:hypothetical protein